MAEVVASVQSDVAHAEADKDDDDMPEEPEQVAIRNFRIEVPSHVGKFVKESIDEDTSAYLASGNIHVDLSQQNHDRSGELASIPMVLLDDSYFQDVEKAPSCAVCSGEHLVGTRVKHLHCGHLACSDCLDQWFKQNVCCPTCNAFLLDNSSAQWSPPPPQVMHEPIKNETPLDFVGNTLADVSTAKAVDETNFNDLPPGPFMDATEPDVEPASNFEIVPPSPSRHEVALAIPPEEPPPLLPTMSGDAELGEAGEQIGHRDSNDTKRSSLSVEMTITKSNAFGVDTFTMYTSRMVKYPKSLLCLYIVVILIVIVVGILNRPFELETDFSAFVRADGEAMLRRDAYLLALKERSGENDDDSRRLFERDEDSAVENSLRWMSTESGREVDLVEDGLDFDSFEVRSENLDSGNLSADEIKRDGDKARRLQGFYFIKKEFTLTYVAEDGVNLFNALGSVRAFEEGLRNLPKYKEACLKDSVPASIALCDPGDSLVPYAFPTEKKTATESSTVISTTPAPVTDVTDAERFSFTFDGRGGLMLDESVWLTYLKESGKDLYRFFPRSYILGPTMGNVSIVPPKAIRSTFSIKFIVGMQGVSMSGINKKKAEIQTRWDEIVADELYPYLEKGWENVFKPSRNVPVKMYFYGDGVTSYQVNHTIFMDCLWAIGSFTFVLLYLRFHTGSQVISVSSLGIIFISVPVAYVLTPAKNTTVVYFLALFLITGVGSDVVFVFTDYWEQAQRVRKPVEVQLAWMIMQAGKSCLATSLTTSVSFFANLAMALQPLREFGLFMGLCVMSAFLFVLLLLPPLLYLCQRFKQRPAQVMDEAAISNKGVEQLSLQDAAAVEESVHEGARVEKKNKKKKKQSSKPCVRWLLLTITDFVVRRPRKIVMFFSALVSLFLVGIILGAEQDSGVPALFPDDHNHVQAEEWQDEFTSLTSPPFASVEGGSVCGVNQVSSAACLFHWCDSPSLDTFGSPDFTSGYCWRAPAKVEQIKRGSDPWKTWSSTLSSEDSQLFELSAPDSTAECNTLEMQVRAAVHTQPMFAEFRQSLKTLVEDTLNVSRTYEYGSLQKLPNLVFEDWGSGTSVVSQFFGFGAIGFKQIVLNSSGNESVIKRVCTSDVVCSFGTPQCSLGNTQALGTVRTTRNLLDVTEDETMPRRLVLAENLQQPGAYRGPLTVPASRQTDVTMVFGIRAADSVPVVGAMDKPWEYDPSFDIANPWAQRAIYAACMDITPDLLVVRTNCWINSFRGYLLAKTPAVRFPSRDFETEIDSWYQDRIGKLRISENLWRDKGKTRAVKIAFYTNFDSLASASAGLSFQKKWQAYTDKMNALASITANRAFPTANLFVRAEAEDAIIKSTLSTIAIAALCTWLCMLLFTKDFCIACLVTVLVLGIIAGLAFFMVVIKGWKVGATEVLALIVFMGYAVTYSLHIAHNFAKLGHSPNQEMIDLEKEWILKENQRAQRKAKQLFRQFGAAAGDGYAYNEMKDDIQLKDDTGTVPSSGSLREAAKADGSEALEKRQLTKEELRRARVRMAMLQVGGATISSAISTIGCSFFLLFCTMNIFVKLGSVVIAVTILSIVFALVALPATLIACYCSVFCREQEEEPIVTDH